MILKILHQKYYDEIGSTTISTSSSIHSGSPLKVVKFYINLNKIYLINKLKYNV